MTKEELVSELAGRANLTRRAAAAAIDNLLDIVVERAAKGEETQVYGLGTFSKRTRASRVGRNPQTGKELKIAATTVPRFTAGAGFKAAVAGKKVAKKK